MIFNSIDFGIFFPLVFILYWVLFKNKIQARNIFIIIVSYIFYGWWDWRFLSLIIISSAIDFYVGKKIDKEEVLVKRKRLLFLSLFVNLGFLGFFKYFNFFVDSFVNAFSIFGIPFSPSSLNIILPVGISFYTFQTLSYTLDIYYRKMKPTENVFSFFAFVAFFPQLVAGPIERASHLLPQFEVKKEVDYEMLRRGACLMGWGFFKKIVIADRLAIYVNQAFGDVDSISGFPAILGVIFFTFQLYLDFSAYSDIAIGTAKMLGFNLSLNFKRPYLSSSFSDFWKRWHISLSSWFKDYVYIPLGGNKKTEMLVIRNVMIVFLLSGLWHGASWNFVIWGGINGLFIVVFDKIIRRSNLKWHQRLFNSIFVSGMWAFSLVFFRAQTFSDAIVFYKNIFLNSSKSIYDFGLGETELMFTFSLLIFLVLFEIIQEKWGKLYERFISLNFIFRWAIYISVSAIIVMFGVYGVGLDDNAFIYFQF